MPLIGRYTDRGADIVRRDSHHATIDVQVSPGKITDVESLKLDGAVHRPLFGRPKLREMVLCGNGSPVAMISGAAYSTTSALLILLNKYVLSSYGLRAPNSLLFYHCALAVLLVEACRSARLVRLEPLRWPLVKAWLPVNLLFVGMLVTSFYALQAIGVGMFTILKNLSNLITIVGDYAFFGRTYSWHVWACLALMLTSVVSGGVSDAHFSWSAYTWQLVNCVFTSAYSLYLSGLTERLKTYTVDGRKMNEFSMVFYNNLLSLPLLVVLILAFGEVPTLAKSGTLGSPFFQLAATLGGLLGFGISFTSMWFISNSTATFYSLTGSMNKILVVVVGMLLFNEPTNSQNLCSIALGLGAGVLLTFAKSRS